MSAGAEMDFAAIIEPVARHLLGEPNKALSNRTQLRFGSHGSVSVEIAGKRKGTWFDHEANEGGGVLDLLRVKKHLVDGEAVKWLAAQSFIPKPGRPPGQRRIVATYDYHDQHGELLFQVVRYDSKDFRQRRPDGNGGWTWNLNGVDRVLYRLPELLRAAAYATVFICEGEKDCNALHEHGLIATTNPGGAGKWQPGMSEHLRDRKVVILPDNDAAGAKHADDVARTLQGKARSIRLLRLPGLPDKGDLSDWLAAGGTAEELDRLAAGADGPHARPNGADTAPEPPPAEEEETASEQPHGDADANAETLPFMLFGAIKPALDSNDFVEGLLASSSLVVLYGEPGSGKTFWVLDICLHVADGRQWRDRAVEQGAVIYLALEGGAGIRNRIAAARSRMALPDTTPLVLVQSPVDLCHGNADVAKVIATIKLIGKQLAMPVRIVVVDTLARAMAGGNENAPEDMGALVAHSDLIRDQTGACVFYVHHCGKDAARGSRGHSSLKAATDTEIEVTRGADQVSIARVTRQRDMESEGSFAFKLQPVELGLNQRGKPVTSCVVTPADASAEPTGVVPLTDNERIALRCLDQAMKADAVLATVFDDDVEGLVVRTDDWRGWFYREGKPGADRKAKEKAFKRAVDGLLAKGRIGTRDDLIWPTARCP
jgi:hypothetical protein